FSGPSIDATGNAISIVALDLANESLNVATDASGATRSSGSWSGAGFAIGQPVVLSGVDGLRRITGFANGGFTLVVDGLPLPTMTGVTVGQVRIGGDTIIVTGDTSTTAAGGPNSPLVIYGDTSQDGTWYAGRTDVLSLGIFGNKPFAHDENVPVTVIKSADGLTALVTRTDGLSWPDKGFAVGAQLAVNGVFYGTVSKTSA